MAGLVDPQWLQDHLDDPSVRVVQVDEDEMLYELGHIPGALWLQWDVDFCRQDSRDVVGAKGFADAMSRLGVEPATTVVVYGDQGGLWAAYVYWVLRYWGHGDVRLLDGGHGAWTSEGRPLVTEVPRVTPTQYPPPAGANRTLRANFVEVAALVGDGGIGLIDARSEGLYRGAPPEGCPFPMAHRHGHIPGAVNVGWPTLFDPETFRFLDPGELRERYEQAGVRWDRPVVSYCLVGAASALTFVVLADHLGHPDVRNYDGSWMEWGGAIATPVED
jgi:thiosulfate/3-mercaptopyruvate sulfurtransferase